MNNAINSQFFEERKALMDWYATEDIKITREFWDKNPVVKGTGDSTASAHKALLREYVQKLKALHEKYGVPLPEKKEK